MSLVVPPSVVVPFANAAGPDYIAVIPVDSQIGIDNGVASYTDGFPPLNFLDPTAGGIPPRGKDFNGILFALSAWVAWLAAGNAATFNQDVVDIAGGYPAGAIIRGGSPATFWFNAVDPNVNDPDIDPTGWIRLGVLGNSGELQTETLPAGTTTLFQVDGAQIGFVDITTNVAGSTIDGINSGEFAQTVVFTNVGAGPLTILAAATVRLPTDFTLLQNSSLALKYCEALNLWCPL